MSLIDLAYTVGLGLVVLGLLAAVAIVGTLAYDSWKRRSSK